MLDPALSYAREHRDTQLASLLDLLRIPSISTKPEHARDLERAAAWLADHLHGIGMPRVEIMPTGGPPVVYAEWLEAGEAAPTLLAYAHYDVQPADPLELWKTGPFEPTVRNDNLYARGASDDKGQLMAILAAVEAYLKTAGRLPVNLKLLFEGEEEISSPNTIPWVQAHAGLLAADAVLMCDSAMLGPQAPLITYGVRGLVYMQVEVRGPREDLHSGTFGGVVDNPFNVLVRILAQLQDPATHRVTIPGFYDKVRPLDEEERALLARVPITEEVVRQLTGVPAFAGEAGYSPLESATARPTLDIHGMPGGFTEPGKKTVIPAKAAAKVSMRLVPDQDPEEIARLFEDHVHSLAPATVEVNVRRMGADRAALLDYRAPAVQAAAGAYERVFGAPPVYMRGGGTLRLLTELQDALRKPIVLIGFGLPDDNTHAPNEKLHLPSFYRGVETLVHYYWLFAE
jgi:acetylornithine deacetylase/succinyl-diaminopimelate desuccinylase-like protein